MQKNHRDHPRMQRVLDDRKAATIGVSVSLIFVVVLIWILVHPRFYDAGSFIILFLGLVFWVLLLFICLSWWIGMNRQKHHVLEQEFGIVRKSRHDAKGVTS